MSGGSVQGRTANNHPFFAVGIVVLGFVVLNAVMWIGGRKGAINLYTGLMKAGTLLILWIESLTVWIVPMLVIVAAGYYWHLKLKERTPGAPHHLYWVPLAAVIGFALGGVLTTLSMRYFPRTFVSPEVILATLESMRAYPMNVPFGDVLSMAARVGRLYWFYLAVVVGLYYWRCEIHPRNKYRFAYNIESFLRDMSSVFKAIVPILHLNPIDKDIPGYEPSRSAGAYCRDNKLIRLGSVDLKEMKQRFHEELGERFPWRWNRKVDYKNWKYDLSYLEPWQKAIFAVVSAVICKDKPAGYALRDALNESARNTGTPDFSLCEELLAKYGHHKDVKAVIAGHLYTHTVLFEMLVSVRSWTLDLHPAQFIWLKPLNRPFWYAQHTTPLTLDRIDFAAFSEGHSIIAQWQVERVAKRHGAVWHPKASPCFVAAARGICSELHRTGAITDNENARLDGEFTSVFMTDIAPQEVMDQVFRTN